jgi:hypothetical protein
LKNKIQNKISEYKADPSKALDDAKKAYNIGTNIYNQVKTPSGGKFKKFCMLKVKQPRKLISAGIPSTNTQMSSGIVVDRKYKKEPTNMTVSDVKRKLIKM